MSMETHSLRAKLGYVVEGSQSGHFYNRVGQWIPYGSPAEAYVWSDEQVAAIRDAAAGAGGQWAMQPDKLHPALYDDQSGVTVITGQPQNITAASLPRSSGATVPADGKLFDIARITSRLGTNQLVAASVSL